MVNKTHAACNVSESEPDKNPYFETIYEKGIPVSGFEGCNSPPQPITKSVMEGGKKRVR